MTNIQVIDLPEEKRGIWTFYPLYFAILNQMKNLACK